MAAAAERRLKVELLRHRLSPARGAVWAAAIETSPNGFLLGLVLGQIDVLDPIGWPGQWPVGQQRRRRG
jgi:hypothetical protein